MCTQCGVRFVPRREHARFCSAGCRVAWNRALTGEPGVGLSTLEWSVAALRGATRRLTQVSAPELSATLAVVGDAVWAVTIVDATMVRYHPEVYERGLNAETPANRRLIEESVAGLRFVRNQLNDDTMPAEFVEPDRAERAAGQVGVAGWAWRSVAGPPPARRGARARAWETARYRAYQAQLAGHPIGEVFARCERFLCRTAAEATASTTSIGHTPLGSQS